MTSHSCKVCFKHVTPGKACALCRLPVCHDHRTNIVGGGGGKTYYCRPPCGGQGAGGQHHPSPYAQHQYPPQQQQQQQHWQQTPTTYGGSQAAYQSAGSFWADAGGGSPSPHHQQQQPPQAPPYYPSQAAPQFQQNTPPQPRVQHSPSPSPSNGSSFASPPGGAAGSSSSMPLDFDPANIGRYGLGCGLALPRLPEPDAMNMIIVPSGGPSGRPLEVYDDPEAIIRLTAPFVTDRRLRKSDTVQFRSADGDVRRGIIVGARGPSGPLVVLERRRAANGSGTSEEATLVPAETFVSLQFLPLGKCRHCGCLIPLDEARLHVDLVHKTTASASTRVDADAGVCVGNVELLLALSPIQQLGAGAQGTVHKCPAPPNVAVDGDVRMPHYVRKDIACHSETEAVARYQQAVRLMSLKHPHVIRYLAVQRAPANDVVRVVMPYYPEDDLNKTIMRAQHRIDEEWICSVVLQLATALAYLHSHSPPILHGDLKPENVMLFNSKNQVILMDFDTSVELGRDGSTTVSTGTMEWMAPEAVAGARCTANSDVWSLGLMAYVLAALPEFPMLANARGEKLLLNSSEWDPQELNRLLAGELQRRQYSGGFVSIVQAMMSRDPRQRPSAAASVERLTSLMEARLLGLDA